jgi:cation diffusion facilitator CzcD-associated flavoprotein CzcO
LTYPSKGCGSDIAGHWYSLSTDLNPNWTSYFVSQPEIFAYWDSLTRKHHLRPHIRLNTSVDCATWDSERQVYVLSLTDVKSGEVWTEEAELVVSAAGGLSTPAWPEDMKGRESFEGVLFHSARWRHDVVLSGKKVGVIGNGCSAYALLSNSLHIVCC